MSTSADGAAQTQTIHASAVLVGRHAAIIRGPAGSGKSRLALALIVAAESGFLKFARLVGDDHIQAEAQGRHLIVRPARALGGLIEVRGLGIRRIAYEAVAVAGLVVDLADDVKRLPDPSAQETVILGVRLPRLGIGRGIDPLPMIQALVQTVAHDV
ncbi:MAG: HPr kinase/phosphorylase [Xanthobacteraceae bacterium]